MSVKKYDERNLEQGTKRRSLYLSGFRYETGVRQIKFNVEVNIGHINKFLSKYFSFFNIANMAMEYLWYLKNVKGEKIYCN